MSFTAAALHAALETSVPSAATGLVVALSGGPDSVALLASMAAVGRNFRGLPVRALHVDHGLQPAAAGFRDQAIALCREFDVPLTVLAVQVTQGPGVSLEAAARDARYAALASQLRGGECLLTAHHREDQAETFLLQALRGAGPKGLSAMPVCRELGLGWHVRPLLETSGSELREFGSASLARFRSRDPMNEDDRFDRVHLRKLIWPSLEQRWPGAAASLSRAAKHAADAQALLDDRAREDIANLRDGEELAVPGLRRLSAARRVNAVRWWISARGLEPPSAARLAESLRQILDADEDQQPAILWGTHALRRYRHRMFVTPAEPPRIHEALWQVKSGASISLGANLGSLIWVPQAGGINAALLPPYVSVRRRAGGETLRPAAGAKTQSLQHLCQAFGILPWMRDALPLVFADDALVAVGDLWSDSRWSAAHTPGLGVEWRDAPPVT
jgi:tRNA(Ile)-lysidine synthase